MHFTLNYIEALSRTFNKFPSQDFPGPTFSSVFQALKNEEKFKRHGNPENNAGGWKMFIKMVMCT